MSKYLPTIGIECHVQFKTATKLFAAVDNDARTAAPNTLVSPICFGLPGTLPVLNQAAIEIGIRAGIALNAEIASEMKFDRKHYFYPDLPKGYQITQFDQPIVGEGQVSFMVGDREVTVGIERAHLEEDAGKSTHPSGAGYSLVDLNRAGTPLLEIVSKPDMHSPAEARGYAKELYNRMKYAEVSDVDLYHGNMRFDVNISLAPEGSEELGIRAEVKNLNSFKSVERAAAYEIERQTKLLDSGQPVIQQTMGWDDAKQKTVPQRSKEDSHDYRYFPEPDIPPITITSAEVEKVRAAMPLMPAELKQLFAEHGASQQQIVVLINNRPLALLAHAVAEQAPVALPSVANWLATDVMATVNSTEDYQWSQLKLDVKRLVELHEMVEAKQLSSNGASQLVTLMMADSASPASLAEQHNLLQMSDDSAIEQIVDQVIADNPDAAQDVRNGETKAIGFLVGQVMKQSAGKANPQVTQQMLRSKLG